MQIEKHLQLNITSLFFHISHSHHITKRKMLILKAIAQCFYLPEALNLVLSNGL